MRAGDGIAREHDVEPRSGERAAEEIARLWQRLRPHGEALRRKAGAPVRAATVEVVAEDEADLRTEHGVPRRHALQILVRRLEAVLDLGAAGPSGRANARPGHRVHDRAKPDGLRLPTDRRDLLVAQGLRLLRVA